MADSTPTKNGKTLKYVSLITLTLQNAILGLSMRYAATRTSKENRFFSSTAVVMAEITKLFVCLILVFVEEERNVFKFGRALHKTIIKNKMDTLKVCVPSLLYVIQNNLLYVSAANLDAATNQVSYQLKILTTAIFSVIILRKKLMYTQWGSFLLLVAGVAMVQLAKEEQVTAPATISTGNATSSVNAASESHNDQNRVLGFSAVLGACIISGFAGVYFEKILKGADISVWMRNVQMSLLSIPLGVLPCLFQDYDKIASKGFFHGYDWYVMYLVALNACGGLLVAMVVKYADNILKGFATSLAIIITCIASIFLFGFTLTIMFGVGVLLVIAAIFLYSYVPKAPDAEIKASNRNLELVDIEKELGNDSEACDKLMNKV